MGHRLRREVKALDAQSIAEFERHTILFATGVTGGWCRKGERRPVARPASEARK